MRIRTIKPEWLEDQVLASTSDAARTLSIALILMADDYGRGRGSLAEVAMQAWRYEMSRDHGAAAGETLAKASRALRELIEARFVEVYEVDGQTYFAIRTWTKHQKVDHKGKPRIPEPPTTLATVSRDLRETVAPDQDLRPPTVGPPTTIPTTTVVRASEVLGMELVPHVLSEWRRVHGSAAGTGSADQVCDSWAGRGSIPRQVHAHRERVQGVIAAALAESDPAKWITATIEGFGRDAYVRTKGAGFELYASSPGRYLKAVKAASSDPSNFDHVDDDDLPSFMKDDAHA